MARVTYDSSTALGTLLAESIQNLIDGRYTLNRVYAAANVASNAGTVPTALEGGAFGAAAGSGAAYWTLLGSIKGLLDAADPGGLATFLSSFDNGG